MKSLRENVETTFAAAAFAERNLARDARAVFAEIAEVPAVSARRDDKSRRPRPSLKA